MQFRSTRWTPIAVGLLLASCAGVSAPTAAPDAGPHVYVTGAVSAPGRIPLYEGRTPFTLVKAIAVCGDFRASGDPADRSRVTVVRLTPTGRQTTVVDFDAIIDGRRPDVVLLPDDCIYVPTRAN